MFLKHCLILLVFSIVSLKSGWSQGLHSGSKCTQPINIYSNLECRARFGKGGKVPKECPNCYDCSQIDPSINKCYYQGKYYDIGEAIDDEETLPTCYAACFCSEDLTFTCAIMDCAFLELPEGCYYTFGLNQCCPTGYKCPNNDTLICKTNDFDGYEGQTFINPKDGCSICECAPGVTGNPGDPHCRKFVCDVEIYQSNSILGYCAAVYNTLTDCCPFDYICPRDDDNFDYCKDSSSSSSSSSSSEVDSVGLRVKCNDCKDCKQCRYGKSCYNVGTKFSRREQNQWSPELYQITNCECVIPPYFTCTRTYH